MVRVRVSMVVKVTGYGNLAITSTAYFVSRLNELHDLIDFGHLHCQHKLRKRQERVRTWLCFFCSRYCVVPVCCQLSSKGSSCFGKRNGHVVADTPSQICEPSRDLISPPTRTPKHIPDIIVMYGGGFTSVRATA